MSIWQRKFATARIPTDGGPAKLKRRAWVYEELAPVLQGETKILAQWALQPDTPRPARRGIVKEISPFKSKRVAITPASSDRSSVHLDTMESTIPETAGASSSASSVVQAEDSRPSDGDSTSPICGEEDLVLDPALKDKVAEAFQAFGQMVAGVRALSQERCMRALIHLGFQAVPPQALPPDPREVLSLQHLETVVLKVLSHRMEKVRAQFEDASSISAQQFRALLRSLGFAVGNVFFEKLCGGLPEVLNMQRALELLAEVQEHQGFTKTEAKEIHDLYDRHVKDDLGLTHVELESALNYFSWTPGLFEKARTVADRYDGDTAEKGILLQEFVGLVREHCHQEVLEVHELFDSFDVDSSGALSLEELMQLIPRLGYSVRPKAIAEVVEDMNRSDDLDMEGTLQLLMELRQHECFSRGETEEILDVFRKHSDGEDLHFFELAIALATLGYPATQQQRRRLWNKVDIDGGNSLQEDEFLKLVRILNDEEAMVARQLLGVLDLSGPRGVSVLSFLKELMRRLGYSPSEEVFEEAAGDCIRAGVELDMQLLISFITAVRQATRSELLASAGLSEVMINRVSKYFEDRLSGGRKITEEMLFKFMLDLYVTARNDSTEEERIRFIMQRCRCLDGYFGLQELYWVVCLYGDIVEEDASQRLEAALLKVNLSHGKVSMLQQCFIAAGDGNGSLAAHQMMKVLEQVLNISRHPDKKEEVAEELAAQGKLARIDFAGFLSLLASCLASGSQLLPPEQWQKRRW